MSDLKIGALFPYTQPSSAAHIAAAQYYLNQLFVFPDHPSKGITNPMTNTAYPPPMVTSVGRDDLQRLFSGLNPHKKPYSAGEISPWLIPHKPPRPASLKPLEESIKAKQKERIPPKNLEHMIGLNRIRFTRPGESNQWFTYPLWD